MSYNIAKIEGPTNIQLTSFWGGSKNGPCIQITGDKIINTGEIHKRGETIKTDHIQLTTDEAQEMVHLLHDYLQHGTIQT
mgnify:CR=1 FL=1